MKTLLTIAQQEQWIFDNWQATTLQHKWSSRGYGNSRILDDRGTLLGRAGGCGYDRYGAALGNTIMKLFPKELYRLAKRECKGSRRDYKTSERFYGLFFNAVRDRAWIDGACGSSCMVKILNKIGFSLRSAGSTNNQAQTGSEFFTLAPITKHDRKCL